MRESINTREIKFPAIPPDDYAGSVSEWMVKLQERGLWNGRGWYGDVKIPESVYLEILKECEE